MATRDELFAKFGATAEAAQLFETDLGTMLLALEGWRNAWHISPDPEQAGEFYAQLNRKTVGQLLQKLKKCVQVDDQIRTKFERALAARNMLNHGFFERHNYAIQTDEGRDRMIQDLESLHSELFDAWQFAQQLAALLTDTLKNNRPS